MKVPRVLLSVLLSIVLPLTATVGFLQERCASVDTASDMTMTVMDMPSMPMDQIQAQTSHEPCTHGIVSKCDCALHCAFGSGWIVSTSFVLTTGRAEDFPAARETRRPGHDAPDELLRPPSLLSG